MTRRMIHLIAMSAALLVGCGDDGEGEDGDPGSAPVIEALSLSPEQVTAGQQTAIQGSLTFRDPDADADSFAAALTLPSGDRQTLPASKTQGTDGHSEGQLIFLIAIAPPIEGTYTLELWMIDQAGNESNHLDGALEAGPPR